MNTKQKKILVGAIVALIAVVTIILVALGVNGHLGGIPVLTLEQLMQKLKDVEKSGQFKHFYFQERLEKQDVSNKPMRIGDDVKLFPLEKLKEVTLLGSAVDLAGYSNLEEKVRKMVPIAKAKIEHPEFMEQQFCPFYDAAKKAGVKLRYEVGPYTKAEQGEDWVVYAVATLKPPLPVLSLEDLMQKCKDAKNDGEFQHFYVELRKELQDALKHPIRVGERSVFEQLKEVTLLGSVDDLGTTKLEEKAGKMVPIAKALIKDPKPLAFNKSLPPSVLDAFTKAGVGYKHRSGHKKLEQGEDWVQFLTLKLG